MLGDQLRVDVTHAAASGTARWRQERLDLTEVQPDLQVLGVDRDPILYMG